ncbi:MAG TPA: Ig-like domain-containing protein, partial [Chroococcales cyanobacterium]
MTKKQIAQILAGTFCLTLSTGCLIKVNTPAKLPANSQVAVDKIKFFVREKKVSSLSENRKTITLAIIAEDPDGGEVAVDWSMDKDFGTFNSTRGKNIQWTVNRDGDYQVVLTATVRGSIKKDEPDLAYFTIPVVGGKIQATELAPEITLAPQSITLFRLPQNPAIPEEKLTSQLKTAAQLTATTYSYDPQSNTKIKQSSDYREIKWTSSDPSLVTVDDNGFVKPADGSSVGKALITASSKTNSSSNAAAQVSVQYLDTDIVLNNKTFTISRNGSVDIEAIVNYSNPTDRNSVVFTDYSESGVTWSSSNPNIAYVEKNGLVRPVLDAATGDVT